jgi:hypothetical protein
MKTPLAFFLILGIFIHLGYSQAKILIVGSSTSIEPGVSVLDPQNIATQLQAILDQSDGFSGHVESRDIYSQKSIEFALGGGGDLYTWPFYRHSLLQYYYWPEPSIHKELKGQLEHQWDYVVFIGDLYLQCNIPGFYALGVNKVIQKAVAGGAIPLLISPWPTQESLCSYQDLSHTNAIISHYATEDLDLVAVGQAWQKLKQDQKVLINKQLSSAGAYLVAATLFSKIFKQNAASSDYKIDDDWAKLAHESTLNYESNLLSSQTKPIVNPFSSGGVLTREVTFHHSGSSSEKGILRGLNWAFDAITGMSFTKSNSKKNITFNYGRANTYFEANKRYDLDSSRFQYSFGFPMQDHSQTGNSSMLYGIDKRSGDAENGTDLGVARKMIRDDETFIAKAIPIRTLYAQLKELFPDFSAYSDKWHMHNDLNRASGAFLFTLLTGHSSVGEEPKDTTSSSWKSWMAKKIGYETAWTLTTLKGKAPGFRVKSPLENLITKEEGVVLQLSLTNAPEANLTVRVVSQSLGQVRTEPEFLLFTPENFSQKQSISLYSGNAEVVNELISVDFHGESLDSSFDGWLDTWQFGIVPQDQVTNFTPWKSSGLYSNQPFRVYDPLGRLMFQSFSLENTKVFLNSQSTSQKHFLGEGR